jgi:regulator of replication initiation timing
MAMTKEEFINVLRNKTLKELDDWAYNWYKTASDRQDEIERLKKQKASASVKETNKKLREENNKLKAKIAKISTITTTNVVNVPPVDADAQ